MVPADPRRAGPADDQSQLAQRSARQGDQDQGADVRFHRHREHDRGGDRGAPPDAGGAVLLPGGGGQGLALRSLLADHRHPRGLPHRGTLRAHRRRSARRPRVRRRRGARRVLPRRPQAGRRPAHLHPPQGGAVRAALPDPVPLSGPPRRPQSADGRALHVGGAARPLLGPGHHHLRHDGPGGRRRRRAGGGGRYGRRRHRPARRAARRGAARRPPRCRRRPAPSARLR